MSGDTPPISVAVVPAIMLCIVGALLGVLVGLGARLETKTDIFYFIAGGLFLGIVAALAPDHGIVFRLLMVFFPDRFYQYEATSEGVPQGPQELAIPIVLSDGETRWLECGLYPDEWRSMCEAVHGAKKFSLDVLRTRFTDTAAREIYARVTGQLSMSDVAILIKEGKGYAVSSGKGEYFFERMATLEYPYPIKPDVLKMANSTRHTHTPHKDNA